MNQESNKDENGFWKNMSLNMNISKKNKEFIRHSLSSINNLKKKNDIIENWNRLQGARNKSTIN